MTLGWRPFQPGPGGNANLTLGTTGVWLDGLSFAP
jgi:hypothetical protein